MSVTPLYLIILAAVAWWGSVAGFIATLVALGAAAVLGRTTTYIELNTRGLTVHSGVAAKTIPWLFLGSVSFVAKGRHGYLKVEDLSTGRSRRLPVPRVSFDVGRAEADEARALIAGWLLAYRGPMPDDDYTAGLY